MPHITRLARPFPPIWAMSEFNSLPEIAWSYFASPCTSCTPCSTWEVRQNHPPAPPHASPPPPPPQLPTPSSPPPPQLPALSSEVNHLVLTSRANHQILPRSENMCLHLLPPSSHLFEQLWTIWSWHPRPRHPYLHRRLLLPRLLWVRAKYYVCNFFPGPNM